MSPESPILFWFISFEIFSPDTCIFCPPPLPPGEEKAPGTRKVGLGGLSLRGRLITGLWISVSHLGGEGLGPGIPSNPSWLAELTSMFQFRRGTQARHHRLCLLIAQGESDIIQEMGSCEIHQDWMPPPSILATGKYSNAYVIPDY